MMLLMMTMDQRLGIILLSSCKGSGIFSIGKMNPESKIVGSISANMESSIAVCWLLLRVEIKIPMDNDIKMNNILCANNKSKLP